MLLKELRNLVESNDEYKTYRAHAPNALIAHVFINQKNNSEEWHLGYFDPDTKKITSFTTEPTVHISGSDAALSKTGDVPPLSWNELKVEFATAKASAEKIMKEHYSAHPGAQMISVLQTIDIPVWNLTIVTNTFHIVNIRIDAVTGQVLAHAQQSLMGLGEFIPGKKKD